MTKQDKVAIFFGIGLNILVMTIVIVAPQNFIA